MKCDYCNVEFTFDDDIECENGYIYHKDCPHNPPKKHERGSREGLVMVVYAINKIASNGISNIPWIYGVFTDQDKGFFIQEYMQQSEDYGHLSWNNNVVKLK